MAKKNGIDIERVANRTVQAFLRYKPRTWDRDDIAQEARCVVLEVLRDRPDIAEGVLQRIVDREISRQFKDEDAEPIPLGYAEDFQTTVDPRGWMHQVPRRTKEPRREPS